MAKCPEGISPQFPDFKKAGFKYPEQLYQNVEKGLFCQKLLAYTLVAVGRIMKTRKRTFLVSPGIDAQSSQEMGFTHSDNVQQALARAYEILGSSIKVKVLKQASVLLPIIHMKNNND